MMSPNKWVLLISLVVCVYAASAQTQITSQVISNGGTRMENGSYHLIGTVGQPSIGSGSDASHTLNAGFWAQTGVLITGLEQIEKDILPASFRLEQNYPNPFNPTTTIHFALPKRAQITIKLFDLLGREIATLVEDKLNGGVHQINFEAAGLPSGLYFYTMKTSGFSASKKLTILK